MTTNQQIRAELRTLAKAEKKIVRDMRAQESAINRDMAFLKRAFENDKHRLHMAAINGGRATSRILTKLYRRRDILTGRLA